MPTWQGIPGLDHLVIDNAADNNEAALKVRQRNTAEPIQEFANAADTVVAQVNYDGTVVGATPTDSAHLATKAYVDGAVGAAGAHNILSETHPDTVVDYIVAGDLLSVNADTKWSWLAKGPAGTVLKAGATVLEWGSLAFSAITDTLGIGQHGSLSDGDHSGNLSGNARVGVRVNSAGSTHTRRRLNLIPGTNVQIAHADDSGNEEIDVTISAAGSASAHSLLSVTHPDTTPAVVARGAIIVGSSSPAWAMVTVGSAGQVVKSDGTDTAFGDVAFSELTGAISNAQHGALSGGDHTGALTGNARVAVKKAGAAVGTRRGINLHEGTHISLTVGDDAGNEEVDVTPAVVVTSTGEAEKIPVLDAAGRLRLGADPNNALDAATKQYVDARAATKTRALYLTIPGTVVQGAGASMIVPSPTAGTITAIKSTARVAASSDYTFDINKGGTTIYTTQGNRPQRTAANGTGLVTHAAPDVTSIAADDLFTVDVDVAGADLVDVLFAIYFTEA